MYIIIVTYNGMQWIEKCLKSCQDYKTIVVDNASTDNTVNFIEKKFPTVVILKQQKNLGFGAANNIAISYALKQEAEHVFLLNQDAYLIDDCIKKLIDTQIKFPKYGILSPIHINPNKNKLDENFSYYVLYKHNPYFYSDYILKKDLLPVYEVPFVNAAAWLISKKCLETLGGFDPIFFHYGEDDNYCQRASFHNIKIGVVPNTYIIHDRESREEKTYDVFSEKYFNLKERYYKKVYSDINKADSKNKLLKKIKNLKTKAIKSLVQLSFKNYLGFMREHKMLLNLKPLILKSLKNNKEIKKHYLE